MHQRLANRQFSFRFGLAKALYDHDTEWKGVRSMFRLVVGGVKLL